MSADRNPELVVAAFYAAVMDDRAAGRTRQLADYQQRFPGYESEIARAWSRLDGDDPDGEAEEPAGGELAAGATFAGYRIVRAVGRGGQGVVYEAADGELDRPVALKVLHGSRLWSPAARARFAREVEVTARLSHPGICPVYARGVEGGVPWIAMRYLEGAALFVDPFDPGDWRTAVRRVRLAADAVAHAHDRGIVHRDLKPGNLWLDPDGRVLVLDFGLAVEWSDEGPVSELTLTGEHFGTPGYMAPEQLGTGQPTSPATDVFALGVVLYELTAGARPFPTTTLGGYERAVLAGPPDVCRARRGLPRDLGALLRVAMAPAPDERYVNAMALRADLDNLLAGRPIAATAPGPLQRLWRWAQRERALAIAAGLLFVVLSVSLVAVTMALAASQRSAATSAITAAAALLRTEQFEMARDRLAACPDDHRGFAFEVLQRELDNGLVAPADADPPAPPLSAERDGDLLRVRLDSRELAVDVPPIDRWSLALAPDGATLALAYSPPGRGGTDVELIDVADSTAVQRIRIESAQVSMLAFSADGTWLWSSARRPGVLSRHLLQGFGASNGEELLRREVLGPKVTALLVLDHRALAIGREDGSVQIVEHDGDLDPVTLCGHEQPVVALRRTEVGFASFDSTGDVRHWDRGMIGSGRSLHVGGDPIVALRWRDHEMLEVWSPFHLLAAWRPRDQRLSWAAPAAMPEPSDTTARHPTEALVAVGTTDGRIALGPPGQAPLLTLRSGSSAVRSVAFSPNGRQLAVGHADGVVTVFGGARRAVGPVVAAHATDRAFARLAAAGHEARLLIGLSPPDKDDGWARLAEVRACRRRSGRPWDEFSAIVRKPVVPAGAHEFALATVSELRHTRPELSALLEGNEILGFLRCGRFAAARERIAGSKSPTTAILAQLQRALEGGEIGAAQGDSLLARELRLRASPAGKAAFAWLAERQEAGVPWHRLGDARPDDPEVMEHVAEILAHDDAQRSLLNELCLRFLIWQRPPDALRGALLEWTAFLCDGDAVPARYRVAHAAALLRSGELAQAERLLRPLAGEPWRDADPEAVAFFALAAQARGHRDEALIWRNRLIALSLMPVNRNRLGLDLLRRELDRNGF